MLVSPAVQQKTLIMYSRQMQVVANSETKAQTVLHSPAAKLGVAKAKTAGMQVGHWSHRVFWNFTQICCKPHIVQDICCFFIEWQVVSSVTQQPLGINSNASVLLLTFLLACIAVVEISTVQLSGARAVTGRCDLGTFAVHLSVQELCIAGCMAESCHSLFRAFQLFADWCICERSSVLIPRPTLSVYAGCRCTTQQGFKAACTAAASQGTKALITAAAAAPGCCQADTSPLQESASAAAGHA